MSEVEITLREAIPEDAEKLLQVSRKIAEETDFLIMDEAGLGLNEEMLGLQLADLYESENNLLLLAFMDEEIVGMASVKSASEFTVAHIGELGISVLKEFWGIGLGTALLDEVLYWSENSSPLRRVELTVQKRNQRAIHLYQKFGFIIEAVMERGARDAQGEFLDVLLMSKLIH
ncbi:GNAT family N-acetyltransferase [Candidatus Enterococcus murrayae]|uniref:GNAT family N-acetyltransferase n=1 Tax=Candidatus Enterococcus murrayae TaxID=2815321 RepID=A0ABS3HCX2_9ENTE|nr:GNAT family N-acetyltransferase [Enterococcus sp. MJM16]MBO0451294.1 GNAT family N-acetyltransferase [Enterococcus sp. MJM16]